MDRLDALGDAELRELLGHVRRRPGPLTAGEVGRALGVPRTVARARLERLVAAGLLTTGFERRTGRSGPGAGRPAKTYRPAPETAAVEFPPRRYELLVSLLLDAIPVRTRAEQLRGVGASFGRELGRAGRVRGGAATLKTALDRLCRALGDLGFHATVDSVSADEAVIVSATCPARPLVVENLRARALDQGMWQGLVTAAVAGGRVGDVVCETEGCLEADAPCRIRIRLERESTGPQAP